MTLVKEALALNALADTPSALETVVLVELPVTAIRNESLEVMPHSEVGFMLAYECQVLPLSSLNPAVS